MTVCVTKPLDHLLIRAKLEGDQITFGIFAQDDMGLPKGGPIASGIMGPSEALACFSGLHDGIEAILAAHADPEAVS